MFTLFEPSAARIEKFLAEKRDLPFSYEEVGASSGALPKGYPINRRRVRLGAGEAVFNRAREALRRWTMYELTWTRLHPPDAPVESGAAVCVVVNHGFCWSLNPCRIVYVADERGAVERFGFAFGTLPGHSETGEERFVVEWQRADDSVWFELLAFARPHHVLARIGFPFVPLFQKKFAADAGRAMLDFVGADEART